MKKRNSSELAREAVELCVRISAVAAMELPEVQVTERQLEDVAVRAVEVVFPQVVKGGQRQVRELIRDYIKECAA
ncbi:hypothetical protein ACQPW1_10220 [Nocardia sp. CA-128927]|uniref:hypothetical protein n=1 Tax=Nocardia sp. CA-128927 TaxID=3239975 RepID=UPI003D997957